MIAEFAVPDIGEGIAEVEIIEWLVAVGDNIEPDQPVATVQTDKAVVEMPTPLKGRVIELGGEVGATISVGAALIRVESEAVTGTVLSTGPATDAELLAEDGARTDLVADVVPHAPRPKAAPSVRRLAAEHGVNLNRLVGSGPAGRITVEDVMGAVHATCPDDDPVSGVRSLGRGEREAGGPDQTLPVADQRVPLRGLRRQIARSMTESWSTVPHITDYREVDASRLIELREMLASAGPDGRRLSFVPLIVKIVAASLQRHPLVNSTFDESAEEYTMYGSVNIGVATATKDGLIVPVIRNADRKSVFQLAAEIADLVELTRTRKVQPHHLREGTYTVNNFGALGSWMGTPIIRVPEVGIAGFGRVTERVVARNGSPVIRPVMALSSVGDHRVLDGDTLAAFTSTLVRFLENPLELLGEAV